MEYEREGLLSMITIDGFCTTYGVPIGKLTHLNDDSVCFIYTSYGSVQFVDISKVFTIWASIQANERINYKVSPHTVSMCQIFDFLYIDMNFGVTFGWQLIPIDYSYYTSFKHSTIMYICSNITRVDDNSIAPLLFASIATRITWKILEILIHQVGVANASVIAIVITVSLIMYLHLNCLHNVVE